MTQEQALAIMESGTSVLLTGAAGTGKTYLLNQFISRARKSGKSVAITATTGLAATHLNGNTIHAWSGIGVLDELPRRFADHLSKQRSGLMQKADVLIIDEISMLHDYRLDMIDVVLRAARMTDKPFGGLQVILCGDFYQLPPVNRNDSKQGGFITQAAVWQEGYFAVCYLEQQYRQADDQRYADILNGIRKGSLLRSQLNLLQSRKEVAGSDVAQTRLLTTNIDVDGINHTHLDKLDGDTYEYEMTSTGGQRYVEQLKRACLAPEILRLKRGARVMCIKNSPDKKYVNGSLGEVIDFEKDTDAPVIKLNDGRTITIRPDTWELRDGDKKRASLTQLPLRLAWAITVHKSQGMTLDAARVDLSNAFVEGMGYVALSRVKSIDSLVLDGINGMALRVSPVARAIDIELRERSLQALHDHGEFIKKWSEKEAAGEQPHQKATKSGSADPDLFEALRDWRYKLAQEKGIAPFMIAHNTALEAVAARKPSTVEELLRVPGFGAKKIENYGADIVAVVSTYAKP